MCAEGERKRVLNALKSFGAVGLSGLVGFGSSSKYKQISLETAEMAAEPY